VSHRSASDNFLEERNERVASNANRVELQSAAKLFLDLSVGAKYSYNFDWLGRPIIQYPQDIISLQEIVWKVRPDLIIETGVAHGGSLILSASLLALLELTDAIENGTTLDPSAPTRRVIGIDIDIRSHNRGAIERHPLSNRITLIEGSSIAKGIVDEVAADAAKAKTVLVCLDSDHTHEHVFAELEAYTPMVTAGSYCIVFDTLIEDQAEGTYPDRRWGKGDNPLTAVRKFLQQSTDFSVDYEIDNKLLVSVAPAGYLKKNAC
jgi:cephalosporin hydroxylase